MANIGNFKKVGEEFQGSIVTLSVQAKGVRIVPEDNRANENAPTHRVYVGRAEIGAAWAKTSAEQRDYLSVKLDDPSFTQPIFANRSAGCAGRGGRMATAEAPARDYSRRQPAILRQPVEDPATSSPSPLKRPTPKSVSESQTSERRPAGPAGRLSLDQSLLERRGRDQIRLWASPPSSSKRFAKIGWVKLGSSSLTER